MNELPSKALLVGESGNVRRIGEEDDEEVHHVFCHHESLSGFVDWMRPIGEEPPEELESVDDGEDDEGSLENDKRGLEEVDVLVEGILAEAVLLVMELLSSYSESVTNPQPGTNLGDENDD